MTWTRLSDDFMDREQIMLLSRDARLLHIEALVWSNRARTDGRVPAAALRKLTDLGDVHEQIDELVSVGLWERMEAGGYKVDWTDQEPAADVEQRREVGKQRQRRHRLHMAGDHSLCNARYCKGASVTRDTTRDGTGDETGPHPSPSRPVPKETGRGRSTGAGRNASPVIRCANGSPISKDGDCCGETHSVTVRRQAAS